MAMQWAESPQPKSFYQFEEHLWQRVLDCRELGTRQLNRNAALVCSAEHIRDLGQCAHGVAISNQRLVATGQRTVTFRTKTGEKVTQNADADHLACARGEGIRTPMAARVWLSDAHRRLGVLSDVSQLGSGATFQSWAAAR